MKKTMKFKRIMSLVAAIAMLCSFMAITVSAGTPSEAKNSVVMVECADGSGYGSGFAIGKVGEPVEFIVTNNHVVHGEAFTTATVVFDGASNDAATANVYFYNADNDIAVLKLPQATNKRSAMVLCPMKHVDMDDEFAALGYPGNQVSDWTKYNMDDISVTKGGIKKTDRFRGLDIYLLDLEITHGNSGGPLVNSAGEVVGINRGAYQVTTIANGEKNEMEPNNYALAIDELLKVIDTDRIPVTIHGGINMMFLIIGGAVLLIIIVLVIVLVVRKKSNKGNEAAGTNYTMPMDNGVNRTVPKQAPVQEKAGARIIAVGGTLNGKRFTVSGAVKIGRDSSKCAIAFPVNTQGVSGVHCEISFSGNVCYVRDLNSSYGTYLADGTKLAPNTPQVLNSGDKFYLASPSNTFEVRF